MTKILVTQGDPAGIGPYVVISALKKIDLKKNKIFLIGSQRHFEKTKGFSQIKNQVELIHIETPALCPGTINARSGKSAFLYLQKAVEILRTDKETALVTAPVSKEAITAAGIPFLGHTEFLAQSFAVKKYAMLMVGKILTVLLLTRHIRLQNLTQTLNPREIKTALCLTIDFLRRTNGLLKPKIALCSVNPHAGINTYMGIEEKILLQATAHLSRAMHLTGPLPSEGIFQNALRKIYDVVVCSYHDQGMIPFKMIEHKTGVNLTLGLPFVRTSPAHGTAPKLLKSPSQIDPSSMEHAIRLAIKLLPHWKSKGKIV